MVGWHHRLDGYKFVQAPAVGVRYYYLFALLAEKVKELQPSIIHIYHLSTDAILAFILSVCHLQHDMCWFTG